MYCQKEENSIETDKTRLLLAATVSHQLRHKGEGTWYSRGGSCGSGSKTKEQED